MKNHPFYIGLLVGLLIGVISGFVVIRSTNQFIVSADPDARQNPPSKQGIYIAHINFDPGSISLIVKMIGDEITGGYMVNAGSVAKWPFNEIQSIDGGVRFSCFWGIPGKGFPVVWCLVNNSQHWILSSESMEIDEQKVNFVEL